jgi:hypothetical protein
MTIATVLAAVVTLLAAGGPGSWLDAKTPVNWNLAGAALPARSGPRDVELAPGGRCASVVRPQSSVEDRAVVARGWSLVGAYHRFGPTSVVMAMSSADGMCRANGYQAFVFVNGAFAGTLAPHSMDARTDGSIASLSVTLDSATDIEVDFARYNSVDPMCCPHSTSNMFYHVTTKAPPRVAPASVMTRANPAQ